MYKKFIETHHFPIQKTLTNPYKRKSHYQNRNKRNRNRSKSRKRKDDNNRSLININSENFNRKE